MLDLTKFPKDKLETMVEVNHPEEATTATTRTILEMIHPILSLLDAVMHTTTEMEEEEGPHPEGVEEMEMETMMAMMTPALKNGSPIVSPRDGAESNVKQIC